MKFVNLDFDSSCTFHLLGCIETPVNIETVSHLPSFLWRDRLTPLARSSSRCVVVTLSFATSIENGS